MTKLELARLTKIALSAWKLLDVEEKEAFYTDTGTIGFVENVANLLHIDISTMSLNELDELLAILDKEDDTIRLIRDELLEHTGENALGNALFVLFDCLLDAGEDTIATSYGNLGVQITKKSMDFVDIESGTSLLTLVRQE